MGDELVFYTNPMSRGRIVRWMLEEVGAPYRTELLDYGTTMKSPEYLAINSMGKVPAIRHARTVVTECAAICAYLADAFPEAGLAPPPAERGPYYRWLFFTAGPLEAAATARAMNVEPSPEQEAMVGFGSYERVIDTLEQAIAEAVSRGGHIAGERFSAADVYVGSHVGWGMQVGTLPERPAFKDYVAPLHARPAAVHANQLDDAAMPPAPA